MDIYIKIEQLTGVGVMSIRFTKSTKQILWYVDGQTAYIDIDENNFFYEAKYVSNTTDTASLKIELYDVDTDDLLYTYNISATAASSITTLTCDTEVLNLGIGTIDEILTSGPILVTAENLNGNNILVDGDLDLSFSYSTDGITFYTEIPVNSINWVTSTTFNLYIRREYHTFYGINVSDLVFSNSGEDFTIEVTSKFIIGSQTAAFNGCEHEIRCINIVEGNTNPFDRNSIAQVTNGMEDTTRTLLSSTNTML